SELAEGPWDENLRSPAAQREMFMRLLRAENQLDNLVLRWPGVIFGQRADFGFDFVSPRIVELTGVGAEQWRQEANLFWQVIHESDLAELRKQIKLATESPGGASSTFRIRNRQTGRVTYVLEHRQAIKARNGLVLGYEGMWLDVTRQTIAEKRLSSAAWKETLAILTMGLAHDFSNVMAGIHSLSESFLAQIKPGNPFQEGLGLIRQNSLQASQLVQRIINLHHGKVGERNYHDLNEIVTDLAELTRKIIPRRIDVKVDLAAGSLPLYVDAVECRQVIINLALNAADAMPQKGVLEFRTSTHQEFPVLQHVQGALPRLPAVCLTVQDNGCGIEARHLASIFEPFFTTKAMDKGSGLGLYNACLFVEKHHGAISVESREGTGTTFKLWLPISDFTEGDRELETTARERRSFIVAGAAGKPLDSMVEFLRLRNYHVAVAHSRAQVIELLRLNEYPYAALLAQVDGDDEHFGALVTEVRRLQMPLKTILQIVGRNEDELDTHVLRRADLILSSDLPQDAIAQQLAALFETPADTCP
ncbi:MAG: PAS domain-containing protein, partial [Verrucomicrobia bacterium]|nr:PAS domain-containing protein [Verrucomicrobiota bacterium]